MDRFTIEDVKGLLARHDYLPVVRPIAGGCVLDLPGRPAALRFYPQRSTPAGLEVHDDRGADDFLPCPEYAIRLLVQHEVAEACRGAAIAPALASYRDGSGRKATSLDAVIDGPGDEGGRSLEGHLVGLLATALRDGFPRHLDADAREAGVAEGYKLIKSYYPEA